MILIPKLLCRITSSGYYLRVENFVHKNIVLILRSQYWKYQTCEATPKSVKLNLSHRLRILVFRHSLALSILINILIDFVKLTLSSLTSWFPWHFYCFNDLYFLFPIKSLRNWLICPYNILPWLAWLGNHAPSWSLRQPADCVVVDQIRQHAIDRDPSPHQELPGHEPIAGRGSRALCQWDS